MIVNPRYHRYGTRTEKIVMMSCIDKKHWQIPKYHTQSCWYSIQKRKLNLNFIPLENVVCFSAIIFHSGSDLPNDNSYTEVSHIQSRANICCMEMIFKWLRYRDILEYNVITDLSFRITTNPEPIITHRQAGNNLCCNKVTSNALMIQKKSSAGKIGVCTCVCVCVWGCAFVQADVKFSKIQTSVILG